MRSRPRRVHFPPTTSRRSPLPATVAAAHTPSALTRSAGGNGPQGEIGLARWKSPPSPASASWSPGLGTSVRLFRLRSDEHPATASASAATVVMQRNAFQSLHRQVLRPLPPPALQSAKSLRRHPMTLINRSFFRFTCRFSARPARAGARPRRDDPASEPAPENRDGFECGRSVRTNHGSGRAHAEILVSLAACRDLPHFGYVRNTSTVSPTATRPACHRCWLSHDARQTTEFPPPQATARANIPLRKRPCCTVVQQQILSPLPKYHSHQHQDTVR